MHATKCHNKDYILTNLNLNFNSYEVKMNWILHFQRMNIHVIWGLKRKSHVVGQ
jgi:hypothetical protein